MNNIGRYFRGVFVAFIIFVGVMMNVNAEEKNFVSYEVSYNVNQMTCVSTLNEVTLFNSMNIERKGMPVLLNYGVNISQYMDAGQNEFKVLVDNAHEFLTPEQITNAYCDMRVTARTMNPDTHEQESREVLHFRASLKTIEENGESKVIIVTETDNQEKLQGEIVRLNENWDVDIYKDGSIILERPWFQTNLQVNHPVTQFSWVNATPIDENDQEIRQKALVKYREIIQAIERKDRKQLKELLEPALSEHAALRGTNRDSYFDLLEEQLFSNLYNTRTWWVIPFEKDKFTFETYGHGKLFAYYYTRDYELSPITWKNDLNRVKWFSPKLMYIDGEVKVGAF